MAGIYIAKRIAVCPFYWSVRSWAVDSIKRISFRSPDSGTLTDWSCERAARQARVPDVMPSSTRLSWAASLAALTAS